MSTPSASSLRRYILTGSVAAITATGAWYGAGLKTQQERNQERNAIIEASPTEKIEQMERLRDQLARRRDELEAKIQHLTSPTPTTPAPPRGR